MVEISVKKTKLMTNSTSRSTKRSKQMDRGLIVTSFKYLGSVVSDEGSKPEILSRIAQMTAALTRLKPVWNNRSMSLNTKKQLMCSFVMSIFQYACVPWTLSRASKKNMSHGNEVLPQDTTHLIQRPCYQRGRLC